jgi:hypothetical protein
LDGSHLAYDETASEIVNIIIDVPHGDGSISGTLATLVGYNFSSGKVVEGEGLPGHDQGILGMAICWDPRNYPGTRMLKVAVAPDNLVLARKLIEGLPRNKKTKIVGEIPGYQLYRGSELCNFVRVVTEAKIDLVSAYTGCNIDTQTRVFFTNAFP